MGLLLRRTLVALTPGASDALLKQALPAVRHRRRPRALCALWMGLLFSLMALTAAMGRLERGANRIYGVQRDRPTLVRYCRASCWPSSLGCRPWPGPWSW